MQVKGKVIVVNPTTTISEKFSLRKFVIETDDTYPQPIEMQVTQDKCSLLDTISVGMVVEVSINLRGKSWTSPAGEVKYFNTLEAWRLERLDGSGESIQDKAPTTPAHEEDSDLPF
jgi:single-strand DNA-binding protein